MNQPDPLAPPFATRIAVLVRDDLATWQRLNVTAFLAAGIAARHPELIGEPYGDADGGSYLPLFGMPVLVFEGGTSELTNARTRAAGRGIRPAIYTQEMFATGHDAANRAATAGVPVDQLDLVGIAIHGPKNSVDKILKGTHLHP